jgi:hypothetical protein
MEEAIKNTQIIVDKGKQLGVLEERNRIMKGLDEADLPIGVWSLIRNIINPEDKSKSEKPPHLVSCEVSPTL